MRFSDVFNINYDDSCDWFDPVLTVDTKLFIDPFQIYEREIGLFIGSHAEIISFFNDVFSLIARTAGDTNHLFWRRASNLLIFPEVRELCLGYASGSVHGSGTGIGFSKIIASSLWEAVLAGIDHFSHFEEIGILREGIGADRISDITANILRHRLCKYTSNICNEYNVATKHFEYRRGIFSDLKWRKHIFGLPINPYNGFPILLCPKIFLRELPSISADNFWDYCYFNENEMLRDEFGSDITRRVDKKTIIDYARRHAALREKYIRHIEAEGTSPYDYSRDERGLIKWYDETSLHCRSYPLSLVFRTEKEFLSRIDLMISEFVNFVENNRGWSLLWNDNKIPKTEEAAQLLFLGILKHYCKANNIDISKEVNIGRGPVDFKTSHGYAFRALLELKLARNGKFWNGLEKQLPKYQEAENVSIGYFVIIVQRETDFDRLKNIRKRVEELNKKTKYKIIPIIVDAQREPPSASRL